MSSVRQQTRRVQRQLRVIVWLRGMTFFLFGMTCLLLILSGIDWLARLENPSLRWLLTLCFYMWAAFAFSMLFRQTRRVPSLTLTALLLESRDPTWNGELAAVVAFQEERRHKSAVASENPPLIKGVEQRVENRLSERPSFGISPRTFLFWPVVLLVLLSMLASVVVAFPGESYLATSRIVWPQQSLSWPQRTNLRVLDKSLLPLTSQQILVHGSRPVEFFIHDNVGNPPASVRFEVQRKGSAVRTMTLKREDHKTAQGEKISVFPFLITPQSSTVRFRAVTNDDQQMQWYELTQISPLFLTSWSMTATSPAYLDLPVQRIEQQVGALKFVAGSQLSIQGTTDRPFQRLRLDFADENFELTRSLSEFNVMIDVPEQESKLLLRGSPVVEGVSSNAFQSEPLKQLQIIGFPDQPPEIQTNNQPLSFRLTAEATQELQFEIRDDFGLAEVELIAVSGSQRLVIKQQLFEQAHETEVVFQVPVSIASLVKTLGSRFELVVRARDRRPEPEWVEALPISVEVVSSATKSSDLRSRFSEIVEGLFNLRDQQQQMAEHTADLLIQYQEAERLRPEDVIALRTLSETQARIQQVVTGTPQGLLVQLRKLLDEWEQNNLPEDPLKRLVNKLVSQLNSGLLEHLEGATQHLSTLVRLAPGLILESDNSKLIVDPAKTFFALTSEQQQIILHLNSILHQLERQQAEAQQVTSWRQLAQEFRSLVESTTATAQQTIALDEGSLTPQHRADLAQIAEQHLRISEKINLFCNTKFDANPMMAAVANELKSENVIDTLNQVANLVRVNDVSQAVEKDYRLLKFFQQLEVQLGHSQRDDPASQLSEVQEVLQLLEQTQSAEAELREQFLIANATDQLLRKQLSLAQQELTRNFELLVNFSISQPHLSTISKTLTLMQKLEEDVVTASASRVETTFVDVDSSLIELISNYRQTLNTVEQQTQFARLQAASRLAQELALQQQQLRNETLTLTADFENSEHFTRQQRRELIGLREREEAIGLRVKALGEELSSSKIIVFAISNIERNLNHTVTLFKDEDISLKLTHYQQHVASTLQNIAECLSPSNSSASLADSTNPRSSNDTLSGELELLLSLQAQLIEREQQWLAIPKENRDNQTLVEIGADQQAISEIIKEALVP